MSTICVVDIWHQGAVLAGALAALGHEVRALTVAEDETRLAAGEMPVAEPGLSELVREQVAGGRLRFTGEATAAAGAEFVFISTDTPIDDDDRPVLDDVLARVDLVAPHLDRGAVLCVTAQVPVGFTHGLAERVRNAGGNEPALAYVPEFLQLGVALRTFHEADRVVVGADDPGVAERIAAIYHPLGRPIVTTSIRTAEMAKHASNAFLATSVSFINEIADICEANGADVDDVARILKLDRRVSPHAYLGAGLGYAGGTLGRDVRALEARAIEHGIEAAMMGAVARVNDGRVASLLRQIEGVLGPLAGQTVALFGLAYKAGTPTLRRSRALEIARALSQQGVQMRAYDPLVPRGSVPTIDGLSVHPTWQEALNGSIATVVASPWPGMREFDMGAWKRAMAGAAVFDPQAALDPEAVREAGLDWFSLGRPVRRGNAT